jgi:hypothetical protein
VKDGQTGTLVAIGGEFAVLDRVSRPEVFASLFEPLVQGYALDALGGRDVDAPGVDEAREFVAGFLTAPIRERAGIGLGRDLRLARTDVTGAGLVCTGELVQLSVFAGRGGSNEPAARAGRIHRPSRRTR